MFQTIDTTKFATCHSSSAGYLDDNISYFICLIVKNITKKKGKSAPDFSGIKQDTDYLDDRDYPVNVIPGCVTVSLPGPYLNLSALFEVNARTLDVSFHQSVRQADSNSNDCKTHLEVFDLVRFYILKPNNCRIQFIWIK